MNINVEIYGTGEPIVFIHGVGGSSHYWYYQREYLKNFMKVILIDLPGHGKSPGDACKTIEDARDIVHDAILELGIDKCYLAGHSMGGGIAMSFALTYSELLKGIILICTGAKLRVLPAILDEIMDNKEATVRMIMMDYAFSKKAPQKMKDNGFKDMMNSSANTVYQGFSACDKFSVIGSLDRINLPALVIGGKDDLLTPPAFSEYLHRQIKDSKLVIIEDAGHMVMLEQADAVNTAIEDFVSKL
ncbi:MAG: alpha/beta fold hydrolase [Syntrophorhabdus sp.]